MGKRRPWQVEWLSARDEPPGQSRKKSTLPTISLISSRRRLVHYLQSGLPDREAKLKALADAKGYLTSARPSGVHALSAGNEQGEQANRQRPDGMKNMLRRYLDEQSDAEQLSVNQLWTRLQVEGVQVGRMSVAEVL